MTVSADERHERLARSVHDRWPLLGLARAHHTNRRGEPMSFDDRPFLIPLYAEFSRQETRAREYAFIKAVQTGFSELLMQLALYDAAWQDRIAAYVLPQYRTSTRYVSDRVDPVIRRTDAYRDRQPGSKYGQPADAGKGNLTRKPLGKYGAILFLGANTPSDFVEFSADTIIVDEYDLCDRDTLAPVDDRLEASKFPLLLWSSNPRVEGGVSDKFKAGTQHRWFHQCPRCNERQPLGWETHFVERRDDGAWQPRDRARDRSGPGTGDLRPVCRRCREPWDVRADGSAWVPAYRGRALRSFHVSRLDVLPRPHAPEPVRRYFETWVESQFSKSALVAFYAGVLGLLYVPKGAQVTQELLDAARTGPAMDPVGGDAYKTLRTVAGIDVGGLLNVQVDVVDGDVRRTVHVATAPTFEDVADILKRYRVNVFVIDAAPETHKARELVAAMDGKAEGWMCRYFPTAKVGAVEFGMVLKPKDWVVQVDRTQLLDVCLGELESGAHVLPEDCGVVDGFDDQMRAPVRQLSRDGRSYVWDEGSKPDHYRHADAYARVAAEILGSGTRLLGA